MPSIYLSASTQEKNIGADGIPEETRMQALARDIAPLLQTRSVLVYLNKPEYSLAQIIYNSNAKKPDLHLALHSNAGGGSGTETWTYKLEGTKSVLFGKQLQKTVAGVLGLPDRGVRDGFAASLGEIVGTDATAVLCELFFHDNLSDIKAFNAKRAELINAIVEVTCNWFGLNRKSPEQKHIKELEIELMKEREGRRKAELVLKDIGIAAAEWVIK